MPSVSLRAVIATVSLTLALAAAGVGQTAAPPQPAAQSVRPISAPAHPMPGEAASAGVTRFSFLAYGDTRGRRDGVELQYEHSLVADSMLATIKRLSRTPYPVRFVVQSGDAVVNGRDVQQWNRSFVDIISKLTTEGDVPYFFAAGNHDLGTSTDLTNPTRLTGLRNLLAPNSRLIPSEDDPRRLAGYPTYTFGYGNTFVIAIDSNIADDEPQFLWVKAQLEGLDRTRYRNVIAFFHHPPFSSGPHGGAPVTEAPTLAMRRRYEPLFRQHQVRMTIAGHEHLFEHWIERYTDAAGQRRRIDHIVTGGGGAPIYTYRGEPNLAEYVKGADAEKVAVEHFVRPGPKAGDNPYHYVIVQIDGDDIQLDVVGVDWGVGFKPYQTAQMKLRDGGGER